MRETPVSGPAKQKDWVCGTMMQIIGARYNERRIKIFATNYMDARRHHLEETLEERVGLRLCSRLYEMYETVMIKGEEYRRRVDARERSLESP
jgi:DNA replication protein DnaC